jgi:hypothetical protein
MRVRSFWPMARVILLAYAVIASFVIQDFANEDPYTRNRGTCANWLAKSLLAPPGYPSLPTNTVLIAGTDFTHFATLYGIHCGPSASSAFKNQRGDIAVVAASALSNPEYLCSLRARYSPSTYANVGFFHSWRDPDFMVRTNQPTFDGGFYGAVDRVLVANAIHSDRNHRLQVPSVRQRDLRDAAGFLDYLSTNQSAVDVSILEALQHLPKPVSSSSVSQRLSELMDDDSWYSPEAFTNAAIPGFLHQFALQNPMGSSRTLLNRHLLSAVYPTFIAPPKSGKYPILEILIPEEHSRRSIIARYSQDAAERAKAGRLNDGEFVNLLPNGSVSVGGPAAFAAINSELLRSLIHLNPERDFFLDASIDFPWLESHLTPHGPIVHYHPHSVHTIDGVSLAKDREWWVQATERLLGLALAAPVSTVELQSLLDNLEVQALSPKGSSARNFLRHRAARVCLSRLRLGSARSVYLSRFLAAASTPMAEFWRLEAHLAVQQALVLCPDHEPALRTFVQFLQDGDREGEARWFLEQRIARHPQDTAAQSLLTSLPRRSNP